MPSIRHITAAFQIPHADDTLHLICFSTPRRLAPHMSFFHTLLFSLYFAGSFACCDCDFLIYCHLHNMKIIGLFCWRSSQFPPANGYIIPLSTYPASCHARRYRAQNDFYFCHYYIFFDFRFARSHTDQCISREQWQQPHEAATYLPLFSDIVTQLEFEETTARHWLMRLAFAGFGFRLYNIWMSAIIFHQLSSWYFE